VSGCQSDHHCDVVTASLAWASRCIEKYIQPRIPPKPARDRRVFSKRIDSRCLAVRGLLILLSGLIQAVVAPRDRIPLRFIAIAPIQGLSCPSRASPDPAQQFSMGCSRWRGARRGRNSASPWPRRPDTRAYFLERRPTRALITPPRLSFGRLSHRPHEFAPSLIGMSSVHRGHGFARKVLSALTREGQWWNLRHLLCSRPE